MLRCHLQGFTSALLMIKDKSRRKYVDDLMQVVAHRKSADDINREYGIQIYHKLTISQKVVKGGEIVSLW